MIHLNPEQRVFVTERHLATLTTLRSDGTPHVVPVAFTWDPEAGVARITTNRRSTKARNAARDAEGVPPRAALCQVDGGRWMTLEGPVEVVTDVDEIADAVERYARRYRQLSENPDRIVLRLTPDRVMCSAYMAE
ncbi:pyridoxamine 5'-phosphate oxidase family protein [Paraoerskovia marina]|uniref:PPOX class probable F420-dependent enzyme n=1 Tax=Paraoerskovia marina TaxID=545619 RepID=A0A1H1TNZ0_9CELL|nr:PPOX class F420-dependent oxidoreductase [Paraoerskovia marina]SDS61862.1 PPOX class probable F420-dependent enzyme [Paraoerskovia marina]